MSNVNEEIIRNEHGVEIGTKELKTEVVGNGVFRECVTSEIVRLYDGKIVINQEIYRTKWKRNE